MRVRARLLATTVFSSVVVASVTVLQPAGAADLYTKAPFAPNLASLPAVDGVNSKFDALGGRLGNRSLYQGQGSLTIPLAGQWGMQFDGTTGSFARRGFGALAGHFFWRDPSVGLLGVYANVTRWNQFGGVYVGQVAAEAEWYWQRWTLQGVAGVEFGNSVSNTTFGGTTIPQNGPIPGLQTATTFTEGFDVKTRFFDQINIKYYLTDNWNAYVGHRYLGGKHAAAFGTEYAMALGRGVAGSAFVEGRAGQGEFHGVWGGLRFYFGQKDKTLIQRHRQDDPPAWQTDTLFSIINNATSSSSSTSTQVCNTGFSEFIPGSCETFGGP
jgi:hypothetical protein